MNASFGLLVLKDYNAVVSYFTVAAVAVYPHPGIGCFHPASLVQYLKYAFIAVNDLACDQAAVHFIDDLHTPLLCNSAYPVRHGRSEKWNTIKCKVLLLPIQRHCLGIFL